MEQFQPIHRLGAGACANIYLVRRATDGAVFVAKRVDLSRINTEFAMKEVRALSRLQPHPHITQYYTHYVQGNELTIIMEYADGGDLAKLMRSRHELSASLQQAGASMDGGQPVAFGGIFAVPAPRTGFTEGEVLYLFRQVCEAVAFLHHNNIVHRDLKPANIFLTRDGRVKVGDLGVCKQVEHAYDWARTRIGTPLYMAPEIWNGLPYDFKGDVWALGCLLYELTTGRLAFSTPAQILQGQIRQLGPQVPAGLARLIGWMLTADPTTRPTMDEVLAEVRTMERVLHPQEAAPISPALPPGTPVCTVQPVVESPAASPAVVVGVPVVGSAGSTPRSGPAAAGAAAAATPPVSGASSAARSRASFPAVRPNAPADAAPRVAVVAAEYPAVNVVNEQQPRPQPARTQQAAPQQQQQGAFFYNASPAFAAEAQQQQQQVYYSQQQHPGAFFDQRHMQYQGYNHQYYGGGSYAPVFAAGGPAMIHGGVGNGLAVAYIDSTDSVDAAAYGVQPVFVQQQQPCVYAMGVPRFGGVAAPYAMGTGAVFVM